MIAFIGSVFSPYYAAARRRGAADPEHYCALNVALYGDVKRWAMTERGRGDIARGVQRFEIGPSALHWDGKTLEVEISEFCMPFAQKLKGRLRVHTPAPIDHEVLLNVEGNHRWRPLQPHARVELALTKPGLSWSGTGYFDSNFGDAPLESGFSKWHWSRRSDGGATSVIYDAQLRGGAQVAFARQFGAEITELPLPPEAEMPRGLWGVSRPTRAHGTPKLLRRLEDAPFYTRSEFSDEAGHGVHESLDLDRFSRRWVQVLLPFRMPRIARK
jgi:carotenoid 1,2-hydratase